MLILCYMNYVKTSHMFELDVITEQLNVHHTYSRVMTGTELEPDYPHADQLIAASFIAQRLCQDKLDQIDRNRLDGYRPTDISVNIVVVVVVKPILDP